MEDDIYKIVEFHAYCDKCLHKDLKEDEEPCDECLSEPVNLYSHKPVKFIESGKKKDA